MRLRFWIDSGLQTFAAAIGACGFYALLMYIQLGSNVQDLLSTIPVYLLAFGGIMLMVMNIGVYKFHLHLALSFGSTRNEAILGLNLFRLIPAVLMAATLVILSRLPGSDFGGAYRLDLPICLLLRQLQLLNQLVEIALDLLQLLLGSAVDTGIADHRSLPSSTVLVML